MLEYEMQLYENNLYFFTNCLKHTIGLFCFDAVFVFICWQIMNTDIYLFIINCVWMSKGLGSVFDQMLPT